MECIKKREEAEYKVTECGNKRTSEHSNLAGHFGGGDFFVVMFTTISIICAFFVFFFFYSYPRTSLFGGHSTGYENNMTGHFLCVFSFPLRSDVLPLWLWASSYLGDKSLGECTLTLVVLA